MREASTMDGFNPRDGVWEQRRDVASIFLGTRLIVHQFVIRQSWQPIGYVPQARRHVAYPWHSSNRYCSNSDQRQWRSHYQPNDKATHDHMLQPFAIADA